MKPMWAAWWLPLLLLGCGGDRAQPQMIEAWAGDAENGRLLLRQFGCGNCHRIPGVAAARGQVGPPLDRLARRVYLAGVLPNTPQALSDWIRDPQAHSPGTAMPDMQVSAGHARDMVAHLITLR
jgi:cytochrome c2